jgi:hypothetical protein
MTLRLINCRWVEVTTQPHLLHPFHLHLHHHAIHHTWRHYKWVCTVVGGVGVGLPLLAIPPIIIWYNGPTTTITPTPAQVLEPTSLSILATAAVITIILRACRKDS